MRLTHLLIPQAEETYEVILTKAFWTYGCEIGINEFGLAMGEEAVYTGESSKEDRDGIIGPDLTRLALERARNCREAIQIMTTLLEQYGQGGSAELKGNSHFDSSFLMSDVHEAYILETAGRHWALKKIPSIGAISNLLVIGSDWDEISLKSGQPKVDWSKTYGIPEIPPTLGAAERRAITENCLTSAKGNFDVKTAFKLMRQHGEGYHPATADIHRNICVHAGPQETRWWQADGAMVTDVDSDDTIAWCTATSGTCVSIFKPVFLGLDPPDIGPIPTECFDPRSLWWRHELLHRRAMADFDNSVPEIREEFDAIEDGFLAEVSAVKGGTTQEKREFSDYCFREAARATDRWIHELSANRHLIFEDAAYRAMWQRLNAQAGLAGLPA